MTRIVAIFATLLSLAAAATTAAEPTYADLRSARPGGDTITVSDLTLTRDACRFTFESGRFHLIAAGDGPAFAAVFLGKGSYNLVPATDSARRHIAVVLADDGAETISDSFDSIVLFFTDDTVAELDRHAAIESGPTDPRAVEIYEKHLKEQKEEYRINFHLRVLQDLLNTPDDRRGIFLAAVDGEAHAPALIALDPLGIGNLAAGFGFLGGEETAFMSLDDLNGGFWYLSARKEEAHSGLSKPLNQIADGIHYEIETELDPDLELSGRTKMTVRANSAGIRVLPVLIMPKLRISSAWMEIDGEQIDGEIIQEEVELGKFARLFKSEVADSNAALAFPRPLPADRDVVITISYNGRDVLYPFGPDSYSVRARTSWYPNVGTFTDLATYAMTFRYPKRFSLVSVGKLVSEQEVDREKVSRWESDIPVRVVGFNLGRFVKINEFDEPSGLSLDVYTNRDSRKGAKDAMVDAQNAARVATAYFGQAPYPQVSVSQQAEWFFGQSWPSLVFLPGLALTSSTERVQMFGDAGAGAITGINEFAQTVGWHEMAHQWWGHLVGWKTYRDQWLSEGFAEFTSGLVLEITEGPKAYESFYERKREGILEKQPGARLAACDSGPISNGFRVSTKANPGAVSQIVYDKGAYVLHMLRMLMRDTTKQNQDEPFMEMMKDFVETWSGDNPSTADFQRIVEAHMTRPMNAKGNGKMDWFFDQWVYGSEIPKIESDLRAEKVSGNTYRISGTVTQSQVPSDFVTLVPIYVEFGRGEIGRLGLVRLEGSTSQSVNAQVALPNTPKRVSVNTMHDVLTR